ncbi:MAG TPA: hypothetical protein VGK01_03475, partial [Candidatus Angelobacter sp.]
PAADVRYVGTAGNNTALENQRRSSRADYNLQFCRNQYRKSHIRKINLRAKAIWLSGDKG